MTDNPSSDPLRVTGDERTHIALRKLARAFLALARHQLRGETPTDTPAQATPAQPAPVAGDDGSEASHE